jgi:hypothetical protein
MQRGGPRGTIPPPSERPHATRRWPLQVIIGLAVVGAAFFILRSLHEDSDAGLAQHSDSTVPAPREAAANDDSAQPALAPGSLATAAAPDLEGFANQLRRAATYEILGEIDVPRSIRALIADLDIAQAAADLEALARNNDRDANVALVRLERACLGEEPDTERSTDAAHAEAAARATKAPTQMRARIEASIAARHERIARMPAACAQARFDSRIISQRLRDAADAGHEASLWQLGNDADTETARRYWLSAAMLGFAPAQVALAQSLMSDSASGERRDRGAMNYWLQAAAKNSPQGKLLLGECLVNACNAQPPDMAAAGQVLREAILFGVADAPTLLASIPSDDAAAPTDQEMYAFESFLERLNDFGCYGADLYPTNALHLSDHLQQLGLRLSPSALSEAHRLADQASREHSAKARTAWHCQ